MRIYFRRNGSSVGYVRLQGSNLQTCLIFRRQLRYWESSPGRILPGNNSDLVNDVLYNFCDYEDSLFRFERTILSVISGIQEFV